MSTDRARPTGMAWVYRMQGDTCKRRFVLKKGTQLPKGPGSMAIALRTSNRAIGSRPNVPEFFNRYSKALSFGLLHKAFADHMIGMTLESSFFARKPLQVAFRALGATLLQALTQGMMALAVLLNRFTAVGFSFTISGQVDDAQINPKGSRGFIGWGYWYLKGHRQVALPVAIDEVCLSFDPIHANGLIPSHTERNKDASGKG